jgi:hypothetical protein
MKFKIDMIYPIVLFIIFVIIKSIGIITETQSLLNWSWWWVTSPIWIPIISVTIVGILINLSNINNTKK